MVSNNTTGEGRLPVLDEAHHGSIYAHVDGLSHLSQEVLLDLKTPLPDAPAAVHQEDQVHLTVCRDRTHQKVTAVSVSNAWARFAPVGPLFLCG